ncbi:MAG: cobU [Gemmatimonadetes bacterium]|nr:cobU [Gemmatimonadota bacterium]
MSQLENANRRHLTLLLGGVRGGKSAKAVALAAALAAAQAPSARVLFVATAQAFDDEMTRRIDAHRRERPATWDTLESPLSLAADLEQRSSDEYVVVVIDCITLWVSNIMLDLSDDADAESAVASRVEGLLATIARSASAHWIIVSNEVGLGVVPPTPLGRRYRDALGRANQLLATAADDVTLMVAGIELPLKQGSTFRT